MDTSDPAQQANRAKRRYRSAEERRAIVEETLSAGASVSRVARRHDVNANQLFCWRKLYREGRLGTGPALLPVKISAKEGASTSSLPSSGTIEIKVAKGLIRISGEIDPTVLRLALEYLLP
jgi:transposase